MNKKELKSLLEEKVKLYNKETFVENDPICIPHKFSKKQDIEITAFWAAVLAWGNRKTIINKCNDLIQLMDYAPHDFVLNHADSDLKPFVNFKHRTFNGTDALYFLEFFKNYYLQNDSLESAFAKNLKPDDKNIESSLIGFREIFFSLPDYPPRTQKHIASPARKSTCKRLCMFLRWMVRNDNNGVDFGIWNEISPSQLVCPLDVHVDRIGRRLGLITRKQRDWTTSLELTKNLAYFDPLDPTKYDFALFGMGVNK